MGAASIFSGAFIKTLKDQLKLKDTARILTGTDDPRSVAKDAEKGSIYLRQTAGSDGQVFVKLDNGSSVNWREVIVSGSTEYTTAILETLKNDFTNSPYNLMSSDVISQDADVLVDGSSTATYSPSDRAMKFTAGSQTVVSVNMLDYDEFLTSGRDIWDTRIIANWNPNNIDTAATYEVSRDGGGHWAEVDAERIGSNTEVYHGDYRWPREEEDSSTFFVIADTVDFPLTNVAGTSEAIAQKFSFVDKTRGTILVLRLKKVGTPVGNYRYVVYSDSSGPSALLLATAWQSAASLSAGYADYLIDINYQHFEAGVNYWFAIETDAAYKASYVSSTHEIDVRATTGGPTNVRFYDAGSWASAVSGNLYSAVVGGKESFVSQASFGTDNSGTAFDDGTVVQKLSQIFLLSSEAVVKKVTLRVDKVGASTSGYAYLAIVNDDSGNPSTDFSDILAESAAIDIGALSTGQQSIDVLMPTTALPVGSYHLVLRVDDAYRASYITSIQEFYWRGDTGGATPGRDYNGSWSPLVSPMQFRYNAYGRVLDLRMRVTSSAGSKLLDAFTMLYDKEIMGISGGVKNIQSFRFMAVADNLSSFQVTAFSPDPDLLSVYHVERGKVYRFGVFSLQGSSIVFPQNFFYNAGVEETVTLVTTQLEGSSFDNSDSNAQLMATNHLGSTDATIDRSIPGRGIFLRRPDGTLRELTIDDSDNIVIYSV